jgi:hypothetical protein
MINHGTDKCLSFGGLAIERAIEEAVLGVMAPGAIEAALAAVTHAEAISRTEHEHAQLKLDQLRYEAERARRQYDAVDPAHRLVAAELERRWNAALDAVRAQEDAVAALARPLAEPGTVADRDALLRLATDVPAVWHAPGTDVRLKKRILRALIAELLVDVDDAAVTLPLVEYE